MEERSGSALTKPKPLRPGTALTIAEVGRFRELLLQAFAAHRALVLDLSALADIDAAGLQLLCSAHRFAAGNDKTLALTGTAGRLHAAARAAGFADRSPCRCGRPLPCLWSAASGEPFASEL